MQDALGAAEKVIEKTTDPKQKARLEELADGLRKKYEDLANKSDNRVDVLEETFPLAMQFNETHQELAKWLDDMQAELKEDKPIPLEPEELRKEVEENRVRKWLKVMSLPLPSHSYLFYSRELYGFHFKVG